MSTENTQKETKNQPNVRLLLIAALEEIRRRMDTVYFNENQEWMHDTLNDPFANSGASWENDTFKVKAYDWGEEGNAEPNFRWRNVSIWWYKYLGRGMEWELDNGTPLTSNVINELLNECMASIPL